jgi:hypothetical protein
LHDAYAAAAVAVAVAATALSAFLMTLATVSLGRAPLLIQYFARSKFNLTLSFFFCG